MTDNQSARQLLAAADRQKRIAEAAETIRRDFRLGRPAAVKKGLFGRRKYGEEQWLPIDGAAATALYDAAMIVKRKASAEAERLEALVRVEATR